MRDLKTVRTFVRLGERFRSTPIVDKDFPEVRDDFDRYLHLVKTYLNSGERTPEVVTLCGSCRFYQHFQKANYDFTMAGWVVLSVGFYPSIAGDVPPEHSEKVGCSPLQKIELDRLHFRKIEMSDLVYVLNVSTPWCEKCKMFLDIGTSTCQCGSIAKSRGYIGESTRNEIKHAQKWGIPVQYLEPISESGSEV